MEDFLSFKLPDTFIEEYVTKQPDWAFPINNNKKNPLFLSELIYVDKYSALKEDGTKEHWYETCRRCVEGYYSILKDHCKQNRTPWNDFKALASAKDAYERMFTFKWLPPGRGLQHMGRPIVHVEQNSASLQNCAFISTDKLSNHSVAEATLPFVRMMEMSMWGIGCIAEGSWITTADGPRKIETITTETNVMVGDSKEPAPLGAWPTGEKETVKVSTVEGYEVVCTPDHRINTVTYSRTTNNRIVSHFEWVEAQNLTSDHLIVLNSPSDHSWLGTGGSFNEGYLVGVCLGDGWKETNTWVAAAYHNDNSYEGIKAQCLNSLEPQMRRSNAGGWRAKTKDCEVLSLGTWIDNYLDHTPKQARPSVEEASSEFSLGFLRGLFDADGHVVDGGAKGRTIGLSQSNLTTLQMVQRMLLRLGIKSSISIKRAEAEASLIAGRPTISNRAWTLSISRDAVLTFRDKVSFSPGAKLDMLMSFNSDNFYHSRLDARVLSVTTHAVVNTYDMTVPTVEEFDANGISVHNCGFDTKGAGKLSLLEPVEDKTELFVVPDNREGWAESVGKLIESYVFKSRPVVEFDYSGIRPSGTPLVRFGGRASGPDPLRELHESLRSQLDKRSGDALTSRDIVDIMNKIGKAVVAGGARRSAQICFGLPSDSDYVNIKNWNLPENAERTDPQSGWAWNSNNSVFVDQGDDYSDMVRSIIESGGEPGFMWLGLAQDYGRLVDPPNYKDRRASGGNPCLEQTLEHMELCTLVETFPSKHDDYDDFRETLKHAYLYGKAVTLMPTKWPESNEVMARNRRIGCSMSGLAEFVESRGFSELRTWTDEGYQFIVHRDEKYSEWLAVRESIKKTSIKPSGTVSIVAGVTPGVHWPTAAGWYTRRVRFSVHNPMVKMLEKAGYDVEPAQGDPTNTVVVSFITKGPDVRDERQVTVWEKAELATMMQRYWADNQVSATLTFLPEEENQLLALLSSKDGQFKGVSFLPLGEDATYAQQPYERLSEGFDVDEALKALKSVGDLYATGEEAIGDKFCDSDSCLL
jgi:ribonucleoside-triphosphate reductase (thioredoxin)